MALVGYATLWEVMQSWLALGIQLAMFIAAFTIMAVPVALLGLAASIAVERAVARFARK